MMLRLSSLVIAMGLLALPAFAQDDEGEIQFAPEEDGALKPADSPAPAATPTPASEPAKVGEEPLAVPDQPAEDPSEGGVKMRVRGKTPDRVFGRYRVRVNYNPRPAFDDGMRLYKDAYNSTSDYPSFDADWFAWDWYVTLGLKFGVGYYTDDGHALKRKSGVVKEKGDLESGDVEQDSNGRTTLTLVPMQASFAAEMTPFSKKWLVVDAWIGREWTYWQEVRTGATTATAAMIEEPTENKDETLTNKGVAKGTVIGAAANILLNPIDEQGAASMRGSMGLGYIYLSPFIMIVKSTDSNHQVSFGRKVIGLGFTFETVK